MTLTFSTPITLPRAASRTVALAAWVEPPLRESTFIAGAEAFAEALRGSLRPAMGESLTVSLGVTDTVTADRTVRGMLHSADLALYAAKRAGRDRVVRADALQPSDVLAPLAAAAGA